MEREPAVDHRPAHALDRLLHGRLRQPDNHALAQPALADVDLNLAKHVIDPDEDKAVNPGEHGNRSVTMVPDMPIDRPITSGLVIGHLSLVIGWSFGFGPGHFPHLASFAHWPAPRSRWRPLSDL